VIAFNAGASRDSRLTNVVRAWNATISMVLTAGKQGSSSSAQHWATYLQKSELGAMGEGGFQTSVETAGSLPRMAMRTSHGMGLCMRRTMDNTISFNSWDTIPNVLQEIRHLQIARNATSLN
jgi:hypothetical protein